MAVVKDWIVEAAFQIAQTCDHSCPNTEARIREVIQNHCPMKDGVAYMPIPVGHDFFDGVCLLCGKEFLRAEPVCPKKRNYATD